MCAGVDPAFFVTSFGRGGGRGEGLSETQGAGPLEAGKKCSAVGINKFCIISLDFLGFFSIS